MTKVINLLGAPGVGKSTLAAQLYADMKRAGHKVELVREVAKEWAWEEREIGPFDQIAMVGEQIRRESTLFGKVDYIITDSPVMLGAFYLQHNHGQEFMNAMVRSYYEFGKLHGVDFTNLLIQRGAKYYIVGRYEDEVTARKLDEYLLLYLEKLNYDYKKVDNCNVGIMGEIL